MNLNEVEINSFLILKNEDKVVLFRILLLLTGIIFWCIYDKERHWLRIKAKRKNKIIVAFTAATTGALVKQIIYFLY